jgi:hypothetical protein
MKGYALVFKGTDKVIQIEQGLFYGQPTAAIRFELMTFEEINRLVTNKAFLQNITNGSCEIKEYELVCSRVMEIEPIPPTPVEIQYRLKELK